MLLVNNINLIEYCHLFEFSKKMHAALLRFKFNLQFIACQ